MPVKLKKGADFNGQRAQNASDASAATDLTTLQQVQALAAGARDIKDAVRAAATGNITLTAPGASIDGVTMAAGDRFLAHLQTTASAKGIYIWNGAASTATRATDMDANAEVTQGLAVTVTEGTQKGTGATQTAPVTWVLTTPDPIVLGTTSLTFALLGGAAAGGSNYQTVQEGGGALTQRPTLNFGAGVVATDNAGSTRTDIDIDTALVARKFAASCVVTTNPQTFNHALGTDVIIQAFLVATGEVIYPDITNAATAGGTATVDYGGAPSAAEYRVVVHG